MNSKLFWPTFSDYMHWCQCFSSRKGHQHEWRNTSGFHHISDQSLVGFIMQGDRTKPSRQGEGCLGFSRWSNQAICPCPIGKVIWLQCWFVSMLVAELHEYQMPDTTIRQIVLKCVTSVLNRVIPISWVFVSCKHVQVLNATQYICKYFIKHNHEDSYIWHVVNGPHAKYIKKSCHQNSTSLILGWHLQLFLALRSFLAKKSSFNTQTVSTSSALRRWICKKLL